MPDSRGVFAERQDEQFIVIVGAELGSLGTQPWGKVNAAALVFVSGLRFQSYSALQPYPSFRPKLNCA